METSLFALLLLAAFFSECVHGTCAASPCFQLESLTAHANCIDALGNQALLSRPPDCWLTKLHRDVAGSAARFINESAQQLLFEVGSENCYISTSECSLKSVRTSTQKQFDSWLPCQPTTVSTYLIFTIRAALGLKIWNTFLTTSGKKYIIKVGTERSANQPDVFRSDFLDNLNTLIPQLPKREIQVVVYKNNAPVLTLNFDASKLALTAQNWFSKSNLKSSWPVTDLAARTFNYFSVAGHVSTTAGWKHERRFFINYYYSDCPNDAGLLMVIDVDDVCSYSKGNFSAAPRILFNTRADGYWVAGVQSADRFSIFVT